MADQTKRQDLRKTHYQAKLDLFAEIDPYIASELAARNAANQYLAAFGDSYGVLSQVIPNLVDLINSIPQGGGGTESVTVGDGTFTGDFSQKIPGVSYATYEATAYAPSLGGTNWDGDPQTATGTLVAEGRTIAVDPKKIPYGSVVAIYCKAFPQVNGLYCAEDTGGAIKGNRIDIGMSEDIVWDFGRRDIEVAVLEQGKGRKDALAKSKRWNEVEAEWISKLKIPSSGTQTSAGTGAIGAIIEGAKHTLANGINGKKVVYVFGGNGPVGWDCSSWLQYVFKTYGNTALPRTTREQARVGTPISKGNFQVGDLLFFNTSGAGISHVGIWIGGDQMIHNSSKGVNITKVFGNSYWAPKYLTATRILQPSATPATTSSTKPASGNKSAGNKGVFHASADSSDDVKVTSITIGESKREFTIPSRLDYSVLAQGLHPLSIVGGKVIIPRGIDRMAHQQVRNSWAMNIHFEGFLRMNTPWVFDKPWENRFAPDFAQAMGLLASVILSVSEWKTIRVASGTRLGDTRSHGGGYAIDIQCTNRQECLMIADVAWSLGFRAVAIGGNVDKGAGHVHIDGSVAHQWDEGYGVYAGPTSFTDWR